MYQKKDHLEVTILLAKCSRVILVLLSPLLHHHMVYLYQALKTELFVCGIVLTNLLRTKKTSFVSRKRMMQLTTENVEKINGHDVFTL